MPKELGKTDKTYSAKQVKERARSLRKSGYAVSKYKVKKGIHKGRFRIHLSEDKRKSRAKKRKK